MLAPNSTAADLLVHIDGKLVSATEARVSIFDHASLCQDRVIHAVCARDGILNGPLAHIDWQARSVPSIGANISLTRNAIAEASLKCPCHSSLKNAGIHLSIDHILLGTTKAASMCLAASQDLPAQNEKPSPRVEHISDGRRLCHTPGMLMPTGSVHGLLGHAASPGPLHPKRFGPHFARLGRAECPTPIPG